MKLILQIALGVFLGTLASQFAIDSWRTHLEEIAKATAEKLQADQQRTRIEQGERIRAMFLQGRQANKPIADKPPTGFVPDDAQVVMPKEKKQ